MSYYNDSCLVDFVDNAFTFNLASMCIKHEFIKYNFKCINSESNIKQQYSNYTSILLNIENLQNITAVIRIH